MSAIQRQPYDQRIEFSLDDILLIFGVKIFIFFFNMKYYVYAQYKIMLVFILSPMYILCPIMMDEKSIDSKYYIAVTIDQ